MWGPDIYRDGLLRFSERALARVLHELAIAADACAIVQLLDDGQHFAVTHVYSTNSDREKELHERLELGAVRALEADEALSCAVSSRSPCFRTRRAQGGRAGVDAPAARWREHFEPTRRPLAGRGARARRRELMALRPVHGRVR